MTTIGLLFEPLDTLFFRGGRPFGAGLPGESSLPSPQSLAGMLRTFLLDCEGADFAAMRGKGDVREAFTAAGAPWLGDVCFRGPWLAEIGETGPRPLVPAPADLRFVEKEKGQREVVRLQPTIRQIPGWPPPLPQMRPLWRTGKKPSKARPELLSFEGLSEYLRDGQLNLSHLRTHDSSYCLEERTGVKIDPATYTTNEDTGLFTLRKLRLKHGVAFYAEADVPEKALRHFRASVTLKWGGEGHHTAMKQVEPVTWPEPAGGERPALLLLSPGFFARGWQPDVIPEVQLRAAAVEGPYAISGWDLARGGPKATRFGVDAGSVYFTEGNAPVTRYLSSDADDSTLGYGFYLKGSWNYAS
jgi:CRISPR-associated protein Cmr3